jgi:hypothetical protein
MNDVRMALATLRMATQFVHPWNFSVATLDYFLTRTCFGERDFGVVNERISFVTNFIDEVLSHNAEAWDDSKPFMTAHEISTKWVAAVMLRNPKPSTSRQTQDRKQKENHSTPWTGWSSFQKTFAADSMQKIAPHRQTKIAKHRGTGRQT